MIGSQGHFIHFKYYFGCKFHSWYSYDLYCQLFYVTCMHCDWHHPTSGLCCRWPDISEPVEQQKQCKVNQAPQSTPLLCSLLGPNFTLHSFKANLGSWQRVFHCRLYSKMFTHVRASTWFITFIISFVLWTRLALCKDWIKILDYVVKTPSPTLLTCCFPNLQVKLLS